MNRTLIIFALTTSAVLPLACKSKGPAPGDALTEREGAPTGAQALGIPAHNYERDYRKAPHDPHGPAGHLNPPASHVSGDVKHVDVGGLAFDLPEGWEYRHPTSAMRRAELGVRGQEGTAGLVVYFFGTQGAGSMQANIDRWIGQFKNPDGSPLVDVKPTKRKVAGFDLTEIEVAGTYSSGMGDAASLQPRPGQRMIATIVNTSTGPYYFKFLGDDDVVASNREQFDALIQSIRPSDG